MEAQEAMKDVLRHNHVFEMYERKRHSVDEWIKKVRSERD